MINDETQRSLAEAKTVVFRSLKYRPRSEQEIIIKLRGKGFPQDLIDQTVVYFKKIGEINDRQFAAGWVRSRLNKPLGLHRIRMELRQKGINEDVLAEVLSEAVEDYSEIQAAEELARRRMRQYQDLDALAAKRRLFGYLSRRGFSPAAITRVLAGLFKTNAG